MSENYVAKETGSGMRHDSSTSIARTRVAMLLYPHLQQQLFSPSALRQLSSFADVVYPPENQALGEALPQLLEEAEVCITGWDTPYLGDDILDRTPRLRLIAHSAGSLRSLLPPSVFERGIRVTHSNAALAEGVAEFTVLLALSCLTHLHEFNQLMKRQQGWRDLPPGRLLSAQVFGIVGVGSIGRGVIERLRPFGCRIQVCDPYVSSAEAARLGVELVDLDTLCATSDIISLHAPMLPETRGMIQAAQFARMRDGAIFLNTARAALVDEEALLNELCAGRIFAALDVFNQEPLPAGSPLRTLPNVILSPHIAALTKDTLFKQGQMMVDEVQCFLQGQKPRYEVKPEMWSIMA
ncbi:MAG TPA: hydroxyacid dehydrogenase [Ktedonosporobacter sp.]|nr:hydroxyacid dehydrogenase [Ktedonosporobacter sp.]